MNDYRKIGGFQIQASSTIGAGLPVDLLKDMTPQIYVPSNQFLRILGIATYTGSDSAAWGKLIWNFYANGQPMAPSLINQYDQLGQQNQPLILGLPLLIYPGSVLSVPVKNNDVVSHTGGVLIVGEYLAAN